MLTAMWSVTDQRIVSCIPLKLRRPASRKDGVGVVCDVEGWITGPTSFFFIVRVHFNEQTTQHEIAHGSFFFYFELWKCSCLLKIRYIANVR